MSRLFPIIIILLLALLISGGYFLWWPKYQEFSETRLEFERKDEEIRRKEEYVSGLKTLSDKLAEYTDELSKIDFAFPTDPSIAALYNSVLKTSAENGVILMDHNLAGLYSLGAAKEAIQEMPFSISVSGSYPAFKNLLSAIYKNSRLIEVNSISFSSPEEGLFTFSLELKTHAYQPGKTKGQEPEPLK